MGALNGYDALHRSAGLLWLLVLAVVSSSAHGFFMNSPSAQTAIPPPPPSKIDRTETPQWLDEKLGYDGSTPSFDVLQKTIELANCKSAEEAAKYIDAEYVFRGPIIGPITADEVVRTQKGFQITDAFPDLVTRPFGYTIDPDNPYRCYWFERWEGTNTGELKIGPLTIPPTNKQFQLGTHIMSVHWSPEGKVIYRCLSAPLDRFEGTVKGAGAIIGLLAAAGVGEAAYPGDLSLRFRQWFFDFIGNPFGRNWSPEDEIPAWWKSTARGADPNDL